MGQSDLFAGETAFAPAQTSLFEGGAMAPAPRSVLPDPADIRRKLHAVLKEARHAEHMPWGARDARMWQTVFPQMANWLPADEADQLRQEFPTELERLRSAP